MKKISRQQSNPSVSELIEMAINKSKRHPYDNIQYVTTEYMKVMKLAVIEQNKRDERKEM